MTTLTTDRIRDHATRLGLTHLTDTITQLVDRAEHAQLGYLDFVDLLLEEELGLRETRRFRNALKLSGLPHHKTLDEFDYAFQPDLDPRKIRDLATLEFVKTRSNVALLGPPGVGKTMIAVALAVAIGCKTDFIQPFKIPTGSMQPPAIEQPCACARLMPSPCSAPTPMRTR